MARRPPRMSWRSWRPAAPGSLGRLDHYEVLEVVGRGGMGLVLKAKDTKLQRIVAVKVLAPHLAASGTARQRFVREAQAAAAVRDEHVVAIHAVSDDGPVPYLVMDFIAGTTLDERIKDGGALEVKEVLRIGMQAARGLAAAHAQGLIHRDVKPGNILLENGVMRVKITDFGLARAVDDASITQSGVITGTPLYMAPEQARAEHVDHRSDLFSLGSVLYSLCTGRPAFRAGSTVAVLYRVSEDTPRPIREVNAEVPDWLCAIIDKLLAKDPAQRFQSAAEVAELLSQHLAHLQQPQIMPRPAALTAPALPAPEHAPRRRRRHPALLAAALATLFLGTVAAGVAYWLLRPRQPGPSVPVANDSIPPRPTTSPFDDRKRENIPPALLAMAGGGDPDRAPPELVAMLGEPRKFLLPDNGRRCWMAQSTDGKLLAVTCGSNVILYDAQTGEQLRTLGGFTNRVVNAAFSPDGKFLVSGTGDNTARVWDVQTGQATTFTGHNHGVWGFAFSPDGKRIASDSLDNTVRVWESDTGKELFSCSGHTAG